MGTDPVYGLGTQQLCISYLVPVHHEVGEPHVVVETDLAGWNTGRGEYLE